MVLWFLLHGKHTQECDEVGRNPHWQIFGHWGPPVLVEKCVEWGVGAALVLVGLQLRQSGLCDDHARVPDLRMCGLSALDGP